MKTRIPVHKTDVCIKINVTVIQSLATPLYISSLKFIEIIVEIDDWHFFCTNKAIRVKIYLFNDNQAIRKTIFFVKRYIRLCHFIKFWAQLFNLIRNL